ncbi:hydroxyacid dehydrogenase [Tabrizicola sp.]|jgi:D-3-phosphoglycerate dehydrogenase / 2-oxoglutarate reductase|uniref:hydroxyacid dehydrogenase n=1 Tax=Tabrizicola sp. TaxID=2005166 RepID=UPI0025D53406|nr:hydroxyacid dehydrogenase [Tabrizicola sp.]MBY0349413.1 hydroxyacid dehydrogenase [Tabrizicola sp.]
MPHLLVAGKLHPSGLDLLRSAPVTFDYVEEISEPSYQAYLPKADALVIRTQPLSAASIAKAPGLQIVSRHGVGYDAVDVPALNARGIPLCIVGDVNSSGVAEHAMMLVLAATHRLIAADRATRRGDWAWRNGLQTHEVAGKRLLILGFGRIGQKLAGLARAFGMEVHAHDPYIPAEQWPASAVRDATLAEALAEADAVSLHLPRGEGHVLGAAELALMKPTAVVVNTARGGLVDEVALAEALRAGRLGGAGIEVFDAEPPGKDHPLFGLDQAVLTPHNAALTVECAERMALASVQNVLDFFAGRLDPALVVNRAAVGRKEPAK